MLSKKMYYIENIGCDDTTKGIARLSQDEFFIFKQIIENLNKNSNYGCMPTIEVYEVQEKQVKEIDINKLPKDYCDKNYVDKGDILYLDNKTYTFVSGNKYSLKLKRLV